MGGSMGQQQHHHHQQQQQQVSAFSQGSMQGSNMAIKAESAYWAPELAYPVSCLLVLALGCCFLDCFSKLAKKHGWRPLKISSAISFAFALPFSPICVYMVRVHSCQQPTRLVECPCNLHTYIHTLCNSTSLATFSMQMIWMLGPSREVG
jgi:hypothetical protein